MSKKEFSFKYKSTLDADFLSKEVIVEDHIVQLQLLDTVGSIRFNIFGLSFYLNTECCILVFDITDPKSLESIEFWRIEF